MLTATVIVLASFAYVGLLFAIAYYGDKRADAGRSIIANPYIYALSLAVYCTSWTFYGSVGRAATSGIGFLPIYLGPTLMAALWWYVLLKIIRISKANRITSIADFIALALRQEPAPRRSGHDHRRGRHHPLHRAAAEGDLQRASRSFSSTRTSSMPDKQGAPLFLGDNTFYIAMLLAAFTILFGTRHLDATERHEGLVAAIAFESVVKLLAFIAVGVFVTFWMYDGFDDIFERARAVAELNALAHARRRRRQLRDVGLAHVPLDARDHVPAAPVPGGRRGERGRAPSRTRRSGSSRSISSRSTSSCCRSRSAGCCISRPGRVDADTFVLTLPIAQGQPALALFAFIGGLSAATGMVIVETIALSTMVCNDLVMPVAAAHGSGCGSRERRRPVGAAARHPARRDRRDPGAGIPLLLSRGRSVRAGLDRPHLVLGRRAVRARHHRRHLLERRDARGRHLRARAPAFWCGSTRCSCPRSPSPGGCPSRS